MKGDDLHLLESEEQYVSLSEADADLLVEKYADHLTLRRAGGADCPTTWLLRAGQVCGIIPLPSGRRLCIEPRAPVHNIWHLLGAGEDLVELSRSPAESETVEDLVEGLATIFVREVETVLERGPTRGFRRVRERQEAIRGRLDVRDQLRHAGTLPRRFTCIFDELTIDTPENRVLVAALQRVLRVLGGTRSRGRAQRCLAALSEVRPPTAGPVEELRLDPLNLHYRTPLGLARLILDGVSPGHRPGAREAPGLVVNMPRLFERFVCRTLAERLPAGLSARWRGHSIALDENGRAMLTPDAVVEREGRVLCVVDAKYKPGNASDAEPGAGDLYQMLAYCVGYETQDAVLVYPQPVETPPLRIRRGEELLHIHQIGLDLSGSRRDFQSERERLCARIGEIARVPVARRAERGRLLCALDEQA